MVRIMIHPPRQLPAGKQHSGVFLPHRPHASCSALWLQSPHTSGPLCAEQHTPLVDREQAEQELQLLWPPAHHFSWALRWVGQWFGNLNPECSFMQSTGIYVLSTSSVLGVEKW